MDALEFLIERKRVCKSYNACNKCPFERVNCDLGTNVPNEEYKRIITIVEKWSKEHPRKTRQSVFLEQYPEAKMGADGVLQICPRVVSASHRNALGTCARTKMQCPDCRSEFWDQEVE